MDKRHRRRVYVLPPRVAVVLSTVSTVTARLGCRVEIETWLHGNETVLLTNLVAPDTRKKYINVYIHICIFIYVHTRYTLAMPQRLVDHYSSYREARKAITLAGRSCVHHWSLRAPMSSRLINRFVPVAQLLAHCSMLRVSGFIFRATSLPRSYIL